MAARSITAAVRARDITMLVGVIDGTPDADGWRRALTGHHGAWHVAGGWSGAWLTTNRRTVAHCPVGGEWTWVADAPTWASGRSARRAHDAEAKRIAAWIRATLARQSTADVLAAIAADRPTVATLAFVHGQEGGSVRHGSRTFGAGRAIRERLAADPVTSPFAWDVSAARNAALARLAMDDAAEVAARAGADMADPLRVAMGEMWGGFLSGLGCPSASERVSRVASRRARFAALDSTPAEALPERPIRRTAQLAGALGAPDASAVDVPPIIRRRQMRQAMDAAER